MNSNNTNTRTQNDPSGEFGADAQSSGGSGGDTSTRNKKSVSVRKFVSRVLMPIRNCKTRRTNIIDQLAENDEEFSVLKLDASHAGLHWERLINAIESNTTVKNVQIHGGLVANMPLEEQLELWQVIGRLPKLEEIHFKYFLEFPLMLETLNTVLIFGKGLKKLTVFDTVLYSRHYEDELINLESHENLKNVFMSQLRIPEGRTLDPIVAPLTKAPNLTNLTIRIPRKKKEMLNSETLSMLTNAAPSLKVLELRRIVLRDEQIIQMAKELQNSDKFKEITIQCDECLREPCCTALGEMLKVNKTLTRLEVWGQKVEEDGFCFVIDCLHNNQNLKVLHLSHDIGKKGNGALSRMLVNNHTMETLYMRSFGDQEMMAKTDYYLKLNATGLRGLQLDINLDQYQMVEKLVKHMDDVNHLYFLLRGNPSFIVLEQQRDLLSSEGCRDGCRGIGVVQKKKLFATTTATTTKPTFYC